MIGNNNEAAETYRPLNTFSSTFRSFKSLSPRTRKVSSSSLKLIILKPCEDLEILPNMDLRKHLPKKAKKSKEKQMIYSRGQLWQQEVENKRNELRWNQQIIELSHCTFSPVINKSQRKSKQSLMKDSRYSAFKERE
jgi:hypothetical protein